MHDEWIVILDLDTAKKTKPGSSTTNKYLFELYFILKERMSISAACFQTQFYICHQLE